MLPAGPAGDRLAVEDDRGIRDGVVRLRCGAAEPAGADRGPGRRRRRGIDVRARDDDPVQLARGIAGHEAGRDVAGHGARVALFGRKINLSEQPLAFIAFLRRVVDDEISPKDAVKAYHDVLRQSGIKPQRHLQQDQQLTFNKMSYR